MLEVILGVRVSMEFIHYIVECGIFCNNLHSGPVQVRVLKRLFHLFSKKDKEKMHSSRVCKIPYIDYLFIITQFYLVMYF